MKELLEKPILNQLYEYRKEDFEQSIYDSNEKIRKMEANLCDLEQELFNFLEKTIHSKKEYKEAKEIFKEYAIVYGKQIDFWSCEYFKLGMIDREKIRNEFFEKKMQLKKVDTLLNSYDDDLSEYIEEQKRKYTFGTKEYVELKNKYNEIAKKYPNAVEVFEDTKFIELDREEINALCELRKIDIERGSMEKKLCFILGMKEVIYF